MKDYRTLNLFCVFQIWLKYTFLRRRHHEKSTHLFRWTSPFLLTGIRSIIIFMKFHFPFHQEWKPPAQKSNHFSSGDVQKKREIYFSLPFRPSSFSSFITNLWPLNPSTLNLFRSLLTNRHPWYFLRVYEPWIHVKNVVLTYSDNDEG